MATVVVLLLTVAAIIMISQGTEAGRLVDSDDFTGVDGSPPDTSKWVVVNEDANDYVKLESNRLRTHILNGGHSYAMTTEEYDTGNFTFLVEWMPVVMSGRSGDIRVKLNISGTDQGWLIFYYDVDYHGWGYSRWLGGQVVGSSSKVTNAVGGKWYLWNITFKHDKLDITITDMANDNIMYSKIDMALDPIHYPAKVQMGVFAGIQTHDPSSVWDDYRFFDNDLPPNKLPIWIDVPDLNAVEDIPVLYNFTSNVSDPDGEISLLSITSPSNFVVSTSGLEVTFQFPNGVLSVSIPLVLFDGFDQVTGDVNFTIQPVNDPPEAFLPKEHVAEEDTPYTFNATTFVRDIDNAKDELWFETSDPYVTVDGLVITALFPDGIAGHRAHLNLTDGQFKVAVRLDFTVVPVDDPPVIGDLGEFTAIEDNVSVFNLTPYLSDIDSTVEDLIIIVRSTNCSVVGQELHFLYTAGGVTEAVTIQVTDTHSMVDAVLLVHVEERNDAPVAHPMSPRGFTEDEEKTVDLSPYIEDEDTPMESITVTCDAPNVVRIDGFNITFLYTTWRSEHAIYFNVSDGFLVTEGSFLTQIESVNDAPVISGIGELPSPIEIELDEGSSAQYEVFVDDEDDNHFRYSISTLWSGVTVTTSGTIEIEAVHGDVGDYEATLAVEDPSGARATMSISIKVLNVNDPPSALLVHKPSNHTIVEHGKNVSFSVSFSDPDIMFGQVLTVTWVSNISGPFMTLTTEDDLAFIKDDLVVGLHRITVHVTDGEYVMEVWVELEIVEPYVPPPEKEDGSFISSTAGIGVMILVVLVVVGAVIFLVVRSRKEEDEGIETTPPRDKGPIVTEVVDGSQRYEMAALGEELGKMADELEASKGAEPSPGSPPTSPPPPPREETLDLEAVTPPTAEELEERQHSVEVREVMNALTAMPRGLPTALWGKDIAELGREIVDGPKKESPDGTILVQVDGRWYAADHTRPVAFLIEWKEDAPEEVSDERAEQDRHAKLEKLENALLEGNISEEMYERLKQKYED